jgi:Eco57I restriction-modification methylase
VVSLATGLRNKLERVIVEARKVAEAGAKAALEEVAVHHHKPYPHMDAEARRLRNRLRARARQLGDGQDRSGRLEIAQLMHECAYEHWHRMLFARFLAENNMLIEPEMQVAISLEEAEELAREAGEDMWTFASRCAQRMLPQIFRPQDPLLRLDFAREHRLKLEALLNDLDPAVFTAEDSLGWVYQFWQTKKKDEVNASEVKIGARELPAVTQLFTEPYMVAFLLDNSLGAWWAARRLTEVDFKHAGSEDELRNKAALPGVLLKYLRFVKQDDGTWTPAAGTFDDWPEHLHELKTIDPCCGSGHFLVAALLMLVPMRMELEGLSAREAVDAVLRDNLHGLELDQRCVELAAFALALAAWRYPGAGGYRPLPELHVACSGLSVSAAKDEWRQLAPDRHNLGLALEWMYEVFQDAAVLGSLLNPAKTDAAKIVQWEELSKALEQALTQEQTDEQHEAGVVAQGLAKAAHLLAGQYHLVITNVPYLARGKQNDTLREFCDKHYPAAKNDLATVFLDRCLQLCVERGSLSLVLPQNWLFLSSYRKFREKLLQNDTWHLIARLGAGAFETISGEVVKSILLTLSRSQSRIGVSPLFHVSKSRDGSSTIVGLDVSAQRTTAGKAAQLITTAMKSVEQAKQLENPDARVALEDSESIIFLAEFASGNKGITTNDDPLFVQCFWEQCQWDTKWELFQSTVQNTNEWGGCEHILLYENGLGRLRLLAASQDRDRGRDKQGKNAWNKKGVAVCCMRDLPVSLYNGVKFDTNVAMIVPHNPNHLPAIWCFCSSPEYNDAVRRIDQTLKVTNATLVKVPFDLDYWTKVAQEKYPNGLPKPYSDDATQWIFHGHPAQSNKPLQVAVARLLGYRWPAEQDSTMELSDEARAWVEKSETLLAHADRDGIVCIPAVRAERPVAERLLDMLRAAYSPPLAPPSQGRVSGGWSDAILHKLLTDVGCKPGTSLDEWLRNDFFEQHCKRFHHRPFIWHIWDGRTRDGFHALVNYHKLTAPNGEGRKLLENLTYSYLGDWIARQRDGVKRGEGGADDRLAAALELESRLKAILDGEPPFDIFTRWKPLHQQAIGWEPDINDGVRVNIRPFMAADLPNGRTGAGILRWKPNINWGKDRGKEPNRPKEEYPWFWAKDSFAGDRVNDVHLTNDEKRRARELKGTGNDA